MIALGETFFVPFALEKGVSGPDSGLLSTWPMCLGAILQFLLYKRLARFDRPRSVVLALVVVQVAALLLIAVIGALLREHALFYFMLVGVAFYWFCNFAAGPVWNIWLTHLVDPNHVTEFFAKRLKLSQLSLFVFFIVAGLILHMKPLELGVIYAALMVGAAIARVLSGAFLARLPDLQLSLQTVGVSLPAAQVKPKSLKAFIAFVVCLYGGVYVAAPFFTVYMLEFKQFGYLKFMVITVSLVAARVLFSPLVQVLLRRVGLVNTIRIGCLIVTITPVLWLISDSIFYLCAIQVLAGVGWSAIELGTNIFIVQSWDHRSRSKVLAWFNLTMTLSMAVGAYLGARLLGVLDGNGYTELFVLSSGLRLSPLIALLFLDPQKLQFTAILYRLTALHPAGGSLMKPILKVWRKSGD